MVLSIYSKSGVKLYETDKFKYVGSFMSDRSISITATSPTPIQFSPDDYVDYRNEIFLLETTPPNKKIASSGFVGDANTYELTFYSHQRDLNKCAFLDIVLNNASYFTGMTTVEFTGTVHQLADRIQANLDRLYPSLWDVNVNGTHTDSKNVSLSKGSCWDAILLVNSLFGFNFTIVNRTIMISSTGTTHNHIFKYGYGNGLYSINRGSASNDPIITRLRCYGSSDNVPLGYKKGSGSILPAMQYIPSIMLPDYETTGIDYIDSENISIYGIREGNFTDETIKPSIKEVTGEMIRAAGGKSITNGRIDTIKSTTLISEDSKDTTFSVDIWDIGFSIEEYRISGVDVVLNITDGILGGRGFVVKSSSANDDGYTLVLNRNSDDTHLLPDATTFLSAGDHFVLTGNTMPDLYVKIAEEKLHTLGTAYLADNDHTKFAYSLGVDEIFMEKNSIKGTLKEGDKLQVQDSDIGVDSAIIIQQLTISYGDQPIPKYDVTLSDKPLISAFDLVKKGISDAANSASSTSSTADIKGRLTDLKLDELIDSIIDQTTGKLKPTIIDNTITKIITDRNDFSSGLIDGAILWKEGLTYSATVLNYKIFGDKYKSQEMSITLDQADATYDRIDTFYTDIFNNLNVAKGIPSENPSGAIITSNQLSIMTVLVKAGQTTPDGLDVNWIYLNNESGNWGNSSVIDNYVTVDFNSTDSPLAGDKRIKITIDVPDTEKNTILHKVGDEYQGGIIFWIDPTSNGRKGLIAAKHDTGWNTFWSRLSGYSTYSTGGRGSKIGTGASNTALMSNVDACNFLIVKYCLDLVVDEYSDWFMPSEDELHQMYLIKDVLQMSSLVTYWSSTEKDWNEARCVSFSNGTGYSRKKNNRYSVRAIRAFDDTSIPTGVAVESLTTNSTEIAFASPVEVDTNQGVFSINIKSSLDWLEKSALIITAARGNKNTGVAVIRKDNLMGYKPDNPDWQLVAIPMYNFSNVDEDKLDRFRINFKGEWPNKIDVGFDDIRYQHTNITKPTTKEKVYITDYRFSELPDGTRTIFTTLYEYIEGTVELYVNGVKQKKDVNYFEDSGKIRTALAISETSSLMLNYWTYKA